MKRKAAKTVTQIRKLRRDREWSQRYVGEKVGVKPQTISLYETGNVWPSRDVAVKLSALFGCTLDELLLKRVEVPA